MSTQPTSMTVEGLELVTPDGRTLVKGAGFSLAPGELVLLVGPSGSGKSTLINVLSGLLGDDGSAWRVAGTLRENDHRHYDLSREVCDIGGLVIQGNALFDDLTAAQNLGIAIDHGGAPNEDLSQRLAGLLQDIVPDHNVASLSGGQRQRVAIARTLLAQRPLLLLDEPNSSLDRYAARKLGELIKNLCREMGRPALVVAHHFDDLLPLADRVLVLNPVEARLRELPPDRKKVEAALLAIGKASDTERTGEAKPTADAPAPAIPPVAPPQDSPWLGRMRRRPVSRWFLNYMREYFWILCGSPLTLLYVLSGALIVGFVTMWFGFNYDLLGDYMRSFVHDEALMGIGFIEATIVVPLICSILMVARNNAIITADIGNRVYSSQFRAMRNLHIPGQTYLVAAILVNVVIGALLLIALSVGIASWSSYLTWKYLFPDQPFELWQEHFFRIFVDRPDILLRNIGWVLLKTLLGTVMATLFAIQAGLGQKQSVIEINYAIARSIVIGVTVTLLIHASIAVLQF